MAVRDAGGRGSTCKGTDAAPRRRGSGARAADGGRGDDGGAAACFARGRQPVRPQKTSTAPPREAWSGGGKGGA